MPFAQRQIPQGPEDARAGAARRHYRLFGGISGARREPVTPPSRLLSVVVRRAGGLATVMPVQVTQDAEFGPVVDLFVKLVKHESGHVIRGV